MTHRMEGGVSTALTSHSLFGCKISGAFYPPMQSSAKGPGWTRNGRVRGENILGNTGPRFGTTHKKRLPVGGPVIDSKGLRYQTILAIN